MRSHESSTMLNSTYNLVTFHRLYCKFKLTANMTITFMKPLILNVLLDENLIRNNGAGDQYMRMIRNQLFSDMLSKK